MSKLSVRSLNKNYKIFPSKWSRFLNLLLPFFKGYEEKAVLKDVSFDLFPGESVGIVGVNGAGKSTLLKVITGITTPTSGEVSVTGRIAALLELGMGFHPDFTGRQNVFMAGQLLGHSADLLQELMQEIEDFAEIGSYIDQPVRTYSSGMQVRLAFSLATAVRPDILIVDEALSVGDAYFQHKSFDRIREFSARGTTLLIVSHNHSAIQAICSRVILIGDGQVIKEGEPDSVLDFYSALLAERQHELISQTVLSDGSVQTTSGSSEVEVDSVDLLNASGDSVGVVEVSSLINLVVKVRINQDVPRLVLGFLIKDNFGQPVFGINTHRTKQSVDNPRAGEIYSFTFSFQASLGKGNYSVSISASEFDSHLEKNYHWIDRALIFSVINTTRVDSVGVAVLDVDTTITQL